MHRSLLARAGLRFVAPAIIAAVTVAPAVALALTVPSSGTCTMTLHEHTWARGGTLSCADIAASTSCGAADLGDFGWNAAEDPNDNVSSYSVCNNTGATRTFRIALYRDSDYLNPFTDKTIQVAQGTCFVENAAVNDAMSSFVIWPL